MSIPASLIESLVEWCIECDDVFTMHEDLAFGGDSCQVSDHHRALDPDHDVVWKVCPRCKGNGELRGWPGAHTAADRDEWSDNDYEDYTSTRRRCEDCGGTGKVRDFTDEAYERPIVQSWLKDYYDTEATYAAERRMGA